MFSIQKINNIRNNFIFKNKKQNENNANFENNFSDLAYKNYSKAITAQNIAHISFCQNLEKQNPKPDIEQQRNTIFSMTNPFLFLKITKEHFEKLSAEDIERLKQDSEALELIEKIKKNKFQFDNIIELINKTGTIIDEDFLLPYKEEAEKACASYKKTRKTNYPAPVKETLKQHRSEIIRKYTKENQSLRKIAKDYNTNPETIRQFLNESGIKTNTNFSNGESFKDEIVRLYKEEHQPIYKLEKQFNCSYESILKILKEEGVDIRFGPYSSIKDSKEEIIRLYTEENWTIRQIADKYKCAYQTISRLITEWGVRKEKVGIIIEKNKEEIIKLYLEKNWSQRQIADKYGCDYTTISNYLKNWGIK